MFYIYIYIVFCKTFFSSKIYFRYILQCFSIFGSIATILELREALDICHLQLKGSVTWQAKCQGVATVLSIDGNYSTEVIIDMIVSLKQSKPMLKHLLEVLTGKNVVERKGKNNNIPEKH